MEPEKIIQLEFFLNSVPKEYLIGILKNKINTTDLKALLLKIKKKEIPKPFKFLENLSVSKLIQFIIENDMIKLNEAKQQYFQFRDSESPIFYLYKFQEDNFGNFIEIPEKLKKFIQTKKIDIHHKFVDTSTPDIMKGVPKKYKGFKSLNFNFYKEDTVLEITFEYLEKINYINEKYEPKYVYNLKSGFLWLEKSNQLAILKCHNETMVESIIQLTGEFFNSNYWRFRLREEIVDKLFDKQEIIKNSLKANKYTNPELFETIIIRDVEFSKKSENPKFDFIIDYERTRSSYNTKIQGFRSKIKISVAESGKISLLGKSIRLDRCRDWLIELLKKIIEIQGSFLSLGNIETYLKSSDYIFRTNLFLKLKNNTAKQKLIELINLINILKENSELKSVDFYFPIEISYHFTDILITLPYPTCNKDTCNFPPVCNNKKCDSSDYKILKDVTTRTFYLKCEKCNEEIRDNDKFECIDKHRNKLVLSNSIYYIFHPLLKIELNGIFKSIKLPYQIQNDSEVFFIKDNKLYRTEVKDKIIYSWDELPAFKTAPNIEELPQIVREQYARNIKDLLERCNNRNQMCRSCHLNKKKEEICLLKIFSEISNGQAHPHSGDEFGDFVFPQKFSYGLENIIGIVKSFGTEPKSKGENFLGVLFRKLTFKYNERLLEQFFQLSLDDSVRFIMVVSGKIIESRLESALIEIARWKRKKVVIIRPQDLIPILYYYFNDVINSD